MATSITINGTLTFDETAALQVGNVPVGQEDNNDNDVSLSGLLSGIQTRLFGATELALSNSFALIDGIARSADNFITTSGGTITSLGFVDGNGAPLPVFGGGQPGVPTSLTAIDGGAISLFGDPVFGDRLALGVDTDGDIVFAVVLDPNATLSAARVWVVQIEALANPDQTNHDDSVNLFDALGVAASSSLEFDFNALPSGQNLFGTVGTTDAGLVVIGKNPVLNPDGTFTNASNTINTSQGGGPTTIGVNNQMFDAGDGAYFTFVNNPVANFLAGAPGGLTQGEADDADNIQYTGGTREVSSAFTRISQIQGNSPATMQIQCFNITGAPQGQTFVNTGLGTGAAAPITAVRVFDENGDPASGVTIDIVGGVATVGGLHADYRIEWDTSSVHDQVLITGAGGKFDIGGFGALQASPTPDQVLNFVVKATDGDTDSSTAGFSVGIDGTGIFDDGIVGGVSVNSALVDVLGTAQIEQSVV